MNSGNVANVVQLLDDSGGELVRFEVGSVERWSPTPFSLSTLSALSTVGASVSGFAALLAQAAESGSALRVGFNPAAEALWRAGKASLVTTSDGVQATLRGLDGSFVANGRVVETIGSGLDPKLLFAGVALPMLAATAAAYAQQRRLEQQLGTIQAAVDRIEERMKDSEAGICDAADRFVDLARVAQAEGAASSYIETELAHHRQAVTALHDARHRYVGRFLQQLDDQQNAQERHKGEAQPWVELVEEASKDDVLTTEVTMYVRSLVLKSKLDNIAAALLADQGAPQAARALVDETTNELRDRFWTLFRRLDPLARIAPKASVWERSLDRVQVGPLDRLSKLGDSARRAHEGIRQLTHELERHVLPSIPERDSPEPVQLVLNPTNVRVLHRTAA